jgi:hypothetical protein
MWLDLLEVYDGNIDLSQPIIFPFSSLPFHFISFPLTGIALSTFDCSEPLYVSDNTPLYSSTTAIPTTTTTSGQVYQRTYYAPH